MSSIGAYYNPNPVTPVPPVRPMDKEVVRTGVGQDPSSSNTAILAVLAIVGLYLAYKQMEKTS